MVNNLLKNLKLQFNKLIDLKFFISTLLSTLGTRVSIAKFNVSRSLLAEAALSSCGGQPVRGANGSGDQCTSLLR
jgi:hypothetical protein